MAGSADHATLPPQSCATTVAESWPSAAITPAASAASSSVMYAAFPCVHSTCCSYKKGLEKQSYFRHVLRCAYKLDAMLLPCLHAPPTS